MAKEVEAPAVTLAPILPLQGTITTFVGRDENGPFYTRLEYLTEADQADFAPKILRGLVARLGDSDPTYVADLLARLTSRRADSPSNDAETTATGKVLTDATAKTPAQLTSEAYRRELSEHLAAADEVHDVAERLLRPALFNQRTGETSALKLNRYLALSTNMLRDDPLVRLSHEAADLLNEDNLRQLGKFTVGAAVAVVEYAEMRNSSEAPSQSGDPNEAA